jgi:hypothetical protein
LLHVLACSALLVASFASTASATTGGSQFFLWINEEESKKDEGDWFQPANAWTSSVQGIFLFDMARVGKGHYEVVVGAHAMNKPLQAQVVAYGANDVRCKFRKAHEPVTCYAEGGGAGGCTTFYVACHTAAGLLANSQFVLSMSASTNSNVNPGGTGGFVETKNEISIQKRWTNMYPFVRGNDLNYRNTHGGAPTITRTGTGYYNVTFPGLGTSTLGVAQVTAISSDASHCKASLPYAQGSDLKLSVFCYIGASSADSDFMLNYDRHATRASIAHQAARAHANQPYETNLYTPARSWSTPGRTNDPPSNNLVGRIERGRYVVLHSALSELASSAWVGAAGAGTRNYCKLESWFGSPFGGVMVNIRCYSQSGALVDTEFVETYQGPPLGPQ